MFDTNIFNKILNGTLFIDRKNEDQYFVTHVQFDELNNTGNQAIRDNLLNILQQIICDYIPTESAIWGVSKWDQCKWSDEKNILPTESFIMDVSRTDMAKLGEPVIYNVIKSGLDGKNLDGKSEKQRKRKEMSNIRDALIAEAAIKNNFELLTCDEDLATIVNSVGGKVIYLDFHKTYTGSAVLLRVGLDLQP